MFDVALSIVQQFGGYAVLLVLVLWMYSRLADKLVTVIENNTKALTIICERLTGVERRIERVEDKLDLRSNSGIMSTDDKAAPPQKEG
jgi:hypothetical protein